MSYTIDLLLQVKTRFNLSSDYQLAKKLGVSSARVSNWMKGKNNLDWDTAFQVADLLEINDQNVVYGLLKDKYENPRFISALSDRSPA
ncbi:helix-turn-helix domain-containing protein [Photobacterium nomapromontoriensis]|uniref:helix-turn-helix domain-containing protein n=1 Tax=Photobacterium nomapromontoriensis TaxID=2910237 RepID=UPI003D0C6AAC